MGQADAGDQLIPRIHGQVPLEAVFEAVPYRPGTDGRFHLYEEARGYATHGPATLDEISRRAVEVMASRQAQAPGPVDLLVVTRQVAASPTPAPPLEAYLRLTPTSGVRLEERGHAGERDLAVELSVCRAHGRSLLGAAPTALIGEVPDRWVVAAGDAQLAAWEAIGDDPPYAALGT